MSARERNLLILLAVVVSAAGAWTFLRPLWNRYASMQVAVRENVRTLRRAYDDLGRIETLRREVRRYRSRLRRAEKTWPRSGGFHRWMARLEAAARRAGISRHHVLGFERAATRDRGKVEATIVRARFRDLTMRQVVELLWRFRTRIPRLRMGTFERFELDRNGQTEGSIDLRFDLVVYGLKSSPGSDGEAPPG